ncbi:sugar nucleotide-binding protein [bacterium]|nr:sugar nucleotide-binding protein [bacterium]
MDSVLVVGAETVVGANLSAELSQTAQVSVISRDDRQSWAFGSFAYCPAHAAAAHYVRIRQQVPRRIIYCGQGSFSSWDGRSVTSELETLSACLDAAKALSASFTLISSDAIFTGPWMFHAENSQSLCLSPAARLLREAEEVVLAELPDALMLRTHTFGWSPLPDSETWLNSVLHGLHLKQPLALNPLPHASPILATDLVAILAKAWQAGLNGIYHAAGAERVNPVRFAEKLALHTGSDWIAGQPPTTLDGLPSGFGLGETSLQTRKLRRALGISMPLFNEGLSRLFEQATSGYRDRLQGTSTAMARAA